MSKIVAIYTYGDIPEDRKDLIENMYKYFHKAKYEIRDINTDKWNQEEINIIQPLCEEFVTGFGIDSDSFMIIPMLFGSSLTEPVDYVFTYAKDSLPDSLQSLLGSFDIPYINCANNDVFKILEDAKDSVVGLLEQEMPSSKEKHHPVLSVGFIPF